jgi:hypothetical protein
LCVLDDALQDGVNINNIITVLPRDATDNAVRERLLSQAGWSPAVACMLQLCLPAYSIAASWSWLYQLMCCLEHHARVVLVHYLYGMSDQAMSATQGGMHHQVSNARSGQVELRALSLAVVAAAVTQVTYWMMSGTSWPAQ